ncbi:MAG: TonB-dependent receptor [Balneolaceae bacterium]|nr:MAG: TonB-dependent receptor [Balneolaceae bacterium]
MKNYYNYVATLLITVIFSFINTEIAIHAQDTQFDEAGIEGTVLTSDGEPIPGATVSILLGNEELVTGTNTSLEGEFQLHLTPGNYTLRISYVSYSTYEERIELVDGEIYDIGEIRMVQSTQQLDEVVVESQAAAVEMRFDRRIYRADADMDAIGGSALDLLENIPSLETDFEGNVSLRGSENVRVLINGRPSALLSGGTDALAAIPSDNIERVEVITNPSARYGAQGDAGVINIVLKRNRLTGLNGSVSARTGIPDDHRISTNLNSMTNNANWFANLGFRYRDRPSERNRFQRFESADTSFQYSQNQERSRSEIRGDVRLGAEFFLSDRQTLTPSAFFRIRDRDNTSDTFYRDMDLSGNLEREVFREDREDEDRTNFEFDLAYEFDIGGESNQKLTAGFKFDYQPESEASNLREFNQLTGEDIVRQRTDNRERTTDLLFQIDYTRELGSDAEIEAGIRSTSRWVDNNYTVEQLEDGFWVPFEGFNDDFRYDQNINAAYGILSSQFGKFSVQGGLRLEQTRINTELTESGDGSGQNYLNLFPSVFMNYELNEQNSVQLSYSRRLSRPRFRNILPFSNFRDSRNIFTGNPNLNPVFSDSYELSYLRLWNSGSVSTSIYHRYRTGVVERITELDSDGITRRFPINLSTQSNWGSELAVSQRLFDSLRLRASANYFYSDTEGTFNDQVFERSATAFFGRVRLQWEVVDGLNLQSTYWYSGPRSTTQGTRSASYGINSGVSMDIWSGDATISLSGSDLLNTRGRTTIIEEPNFYSEDESRWRTRSFRLNFIWRFSSVSG